MVAAPPEVKAFVKAILADPGESLHKFAFADWLQEDRGDDRTAHALRWMAKHGRNPIRFPSGWTWFWNVERLGPRRRVGRMPRVGCWLPVVVGREMCSRYPESSRTWFVAVKRLGWALHRIRELVD